MIEEHEWRQFEKITKLASIEGAKAAVQEHLEVTHKPLEEKVADVKHIALAANDKAKAGQRLMWICSGVAGLVAFVAMVFQLFGSH